MPDPKPSDEKEISKDDLKPFEGSDGVKGTSDAVDVAASIEDEISKDATSTGGMDRMRERAVSKATGKGFDDPEGRFVDVDGAGGYKYRYLDDGRIRILKAPGGRGEGLVLKRGSGKAYDAILAELDGKGIFQQGTAEVKFADQGTAGGGRAKASADAERAEKAVEGREIAQRNAQVTTTVEKGKLDTEMAQAEASRDIAQNNAKTGTRFALSQSDDPDAVLASAKAEADRLLKTGSALEAAQVLNDAIARAEELRKKGPSDDDVVARAVQERRSKMGL
jgi:hypothetical protein